MTIDREFWLHSFVKYNIPNWNCPRCGTGVLRPIEKSFRYEETGNSHESNRGLLQYINENLPPFESLSTVVTEFPEYRYSVMLKCNNPVCFECVVSCGFGQVIEDYNPETGEDAEFEVFIPEYFYPAINIFFVSKKCPKEVISEIKSSFKLFFIDPSASANYVRKTVDAILTNKKIKRFFINKRGKKAPVILHNRIVEFEKSKPDIAKKLFAIKWLGNEGSHTDRMTKNDILDAYEILEEVIDDLYVGHRKLVEKKVSKINKSKKPLHPSS
jgi:hypothetical protein